MDNGPFINERDNWPMKMVFFHSKLFVITRGYTRELYPHFGWLNHLKSPLSSIYSWLPHEIFHLSWIFHRLYPWNNHFHSYFPMKTSILPPFIDHFPMKSSSQPSFFLLDIQRQRKRLKVLRLEVRQILRCCHLCHGPFVEEHQNQPIVGRYNICTYTL